MTPLWLTGVHVPGHVCPVLCIAQVYQNARMLSKDGDLLCYCDLKKLECKCTSYWCHALLLAAQTKPAANLLMMALYMLSHACA